MGREIHQLVPTMIAGDAISDHALALQRLLIQWGYESKIYTQNSPNRLAEVSHLYPLFRPTSQTITLYHYPIASSIAARLPRLAGKKALIYHNITPHHFFAPYHERNYQSTKRGREQLGQLCQSFDLAIGDSLFNCLELAELGFPNPRILPILVQFEAFDRTPPAPHLLERYADGWTNLLFVGRLAPNKCQEDVIRSFAHYHRFINRRSRLFLVGAPGLDDYLSDLRDVAHSLHVENHVLLTGHTSPSELISYYKLADLFLCMSEHEGFCVPLLEAMYHDVPILAFHAGEVPGTLGGSGVLVGNKDLPLIGEMIHRLVSDDTLRARVIGRQRQRLAEFTENKLAPLFRHYIDELLAA